MTMADNLKFSRHKELRGRSSYIHYDNYNAIEVPFTDAIPSDYEGAMGVPISFLDKYCPDQFEILGITDRGNAWGLKTKEYSQDEDPKANDLNRRAAYIEIGGGKSQINSNLRSYFDSKEDLSWLLIPGFDKYDRPYINGNRMYARLLIRKKQ